MHKDQQYNIYLKLGCYKTVEGGGGASITIKKGAAKKVLAMLNVGVGAYKKFHSLKWGREKVLLSSGGGAQKELPGLKGDGGVQTEVLVNKLYMKKALLVCDKRIQRG